MRELVVLTLALCCSGQLLVPLEYSAVPHPWGVRYQSTANGQTTFGHQSFDQTRHEVRLADGRVIGQFSYIDSNGELAVTYFEAGPTTGYRVLGSNILPEAPTADLAAPVNNLEAPVNNLVGPEPVTYTAEVAEARAEFLKIYEEQKARVAGAPNVPLLKTSTFSDEEPQPAETPVEEPEPEGSPSATLSVDEAPQPEETPVEEPEPEGSPSATLSVDEAVADESSRRRREVQRIPLPYLHIVPTETEAKFETKQFKSVAAATPADTTKIELATQEHVFKVPGFKYVQPVVEVKPVKYTALAPQVFPYQAAHPFPFYPFAFPGLQYQTFVAPYTKEEAEAEE